MLTIIREQFAKLPASAISGLRGGLASVALQLRGVVTVATGCSGSEVLFHILALLLAFWRTALGIELSVQHVFATEAVPWKQAWILKHFKPEALFTDIEQFATESTTFEDMLTKTMKPLVQVDLWVCGFECDSVSGLNHKSDRGVVGRCVGKTGKTVAGCVAYIRRWKPRLFVLENVKNINAVPKSAGGAAQPAGLSDKKPLKPRTDLDVLRATLQELEYIVWDDVFVASDFGIPQHRERVYILGFHMGEAASAVLGSLPTWLVQARSLVRASKIEPLPMGRFLVPKGDSRATRWSELDVEQTARVKKTTPGS